MLITIENFVYSVSSYELILAISDEKENLRDLETPINTIYFKKIVVIEAPFQFRFQKKKKKVTLENRVHSNTDDFHD